MKHGRGPRSFCFFGGQFFGELIANILAACASVLLSVDGLGGELFSEVSSGHVFYITPALF